MTYQERLIDLWKNKPGLRGRVNAKCIECIYDEEPGNGKWREQVEACTSYQCPLYEVRPTSSAKHDDEEAVEPETVGA